ncbi:DNA-binding response OmpR family regulator [Lipingzhangella halophila]|uniref:Sensory transduction protein RegX3 n=1 Tax=Lipingzhangella halophila TaxID=1783352 RepID=A0A7W7RD11_9ACTN|nr:response regulator transcription factor [Lipingzhangella halophila]MBB4929694.1 DNA-binding response OmpR family regulator [Lipingzhangella halophila]
MRVLLVEDDVRLADALVNALRGHGYEVSHVTTGAAALEAGRADLILLDLGLPDRDGVELCRTLRERDDVAIIAVTARGTERDRVNGLRSGADDYVVKPFSFAELAARMEAVLRRARTSRSRPVRIGPLHLDMDAHQVTRDGVPIPLTRKEFSLLAALAREPGSVVPKQRLLIEVWNTDWRGTHRTLEVHIGTLRAKLGDPSLVQTVRGVGYRLVAPDPGELDREAGIDGPPHRLAGD